MARKRRRGEQPDAGQRSFGLVLITLGWLLRLACVALIPYVVERDWSALVFVPPLVLSAGFVRWGRMRLAPRAEKVLADDTRARLLIFDDQWRPRVLPAKTTLTKSLEPYFQQNGITVEERFWEAFLEHNGMRS